MTAWTPVTTRLEARLSDVVMSFVDAANVERDDVLDALFLERNIADSKDQWKDASCAKVVTIATSLKVRVWRIGG